MNFNFAQTGLALDGAAPVEFAHAPLGASLPVTAVSAIAAQQVTSVNGFRRLLVIPMAKHRELDISTRQKKIKN